MDDLTLTGWQRRRLERQLRTAHDARLYRRTLAVLEVARGKSVAEVARSLGVTRRSVYYWIDAYGEAYDPAVLHGGYRSGRPSLWTQPEQALVGVLLRQSPQDLGYAAVD
jgi:transposase